MFYITMTDKFLSGWGPATGKINKLIFTAETYEEAEIVAGNAEGRKDMKNIHIGTTKPRFPESKYLVQYKDKNVCPKWYKRKAW